MSKSAEDAIFRPLAAGLMPAPAPGDRVLYAGARLGNRPGDGLPSAGDAAGWVMVQPFAPWAEPLAGYNVQADWPPEDGTPFDYAFVLGAKQADETRGLLAESALRLKDGGWLVAAAANDAGGRRLAQECALLGFACDHMSKHHARIVWGQKNAAAFRADVAKDWAARTALQPCPATGLVSCPGLFAWDKIDAGSLLLARHLRDRLKGRGADFGCGAGYLAREIAAANPAVKSILCIDADARAVAACRRNMAEAGIAADCRQADLTQSRGLPVNLDWIVMNPPFHEGRMTESGIGAAFIQNAAASLRRGGMLYMVANSQLPYENVLNAHFGMVAKLDEKAGYKIYCAVRKG